MLQRLCHLCLFLLIHPQSVDYLRAVAGCRTVPVEVGSRYTDEEWSQTLLTVNEFIDRYVVNKASALMTRAKQAWFYFWCIFFLLFLTQDGAKAVGYLAQHQLFDQVRCLPLRTRSEHPFSFQSQTRVNQIPRLNFNKGHLVEVEVCCFGMFETP